MSLFCRNQFTDLQSKSLVWFLYGRVFRHEKVLKSADKFVLKVMSHQVIRKKYYAMLPTL